MRVLLTGWFSFLHGEATAGDVLAADAVAAALTESGIDHDIAWSPVFRPGALTLDAAVPARYTHLVFACGPVHGEQIASLHHRYQSCRRIAVGVSVIDAADPACAGFDVVLARDGPGRTPVPDLAVAACRAPVGPPELPVAGVILTGGQHEYGPRRWHEQVTASLSVWLSNTSCAPLQLDTRLDTADWRLCATPAALTAIISRLDVVVTMRLHGLVLALSQGVPPLAVDPVAGGGKLTAQATAWNWPAVVQAEESGNSELLDSWWRWCTSPAGLERARAAAEHCSRMPQALLGALVSAVRCEPQEQRCCLG